jgi:PadR family transcriptional regulator PadR
MLGEAGMGVIKGGTLYPVLNRLETEGLVSISKRPSEQGPDRKYYTISDEGRALLDRAAKEWRLFTETTTGLMDPYGEDRSA